MSRALTAEAVAGLDRDGYIVIDLLDEGAVADLRAGFDALDIAPEVAFIATCNDLERDVAATVDAELRRLVEPVVDDLLEGYEIFLVSYISKGVGPMGPLDFHQDLTYTDERVARSVLLWIPLVDVDEHNGALRVVPGSHRWTSGIRPAAEPEQPTKPHQEAFAARARTIPMRAGQAVVYDPALVHGSTPNQAPTPRPVVAVATAPRDATLVHFHHVGGERGISGHVIDPAYYVVQTLWEPPEGYAPLEPWDRVVDAAAFAAHLEAEEPARSRWRRFGARRDRRVHDAR